MPFLLYTFSWMTFNVFLAFLPVLFAYLIQTTKKQLVRVVLFPLWLAFLPNTLYLLTDLIHLTENMPKLAHVQTIILVSMYAALVLIGCLTYVLACLPFFKLTSPKKRNETLLYIFVLNFFMGIGIVLGRMFRFNSWDLVLNPVGVFHISKEIITSVSYLSIVLIFALSSTIFYVSAVSWYKKLRGNRG